MNIKEGIEVRPSGAFRVRARLGSGKTALNATPRSFPATATYEDMQAWRQRELKRLKAQDPRAVRGTFKADSADYLARASLTPQTRKQRTQQHAWWAAQRADLNAPVLSVKAWAAQVAAGAHPRQAHRTLGELPRTSFNIERIQQILDDAFAPSRPDEDPAEFASTANSYRTALVHFFNFLDRHHPDAVNPIAKVPTRPMRDAVLAGLDMRLVREILAHVPSTRGRSGRVSELRLHALAWANLTPKQLMGIDPPHHFHDDPDATREDMIDSAITLTVRPRLKGHPKKIPAPALLPLTPYGVEALRAFAAEPKTWGNFSVKSLNTIFKRGCRRTQAALAARGIVVDLSKTTLYHLKHSLASAATTASHGLVDRRGVVQQSIGVQRALGHSKPRMTAIYTQACQDPALRQVNADLTHFLDRLFAEPLKAPTPLRVVARR